MTRVLVTGGSGFVGVHTIVQLLAAGYAVRTTLRNLQREAEVRAMIKEGGVATEGRLAFVVADLDGDRGWAEATADCEYVIHIASPFPMKVPKHEDELIAPARDGTLRVLRAARAAGVKRVVVTSSFAAVGYGQDPSITRFDEANWTNLDADLAPYVKSKTLAERAAWDFMAAEGGLLELAVVNPVVILGPLLGTDVCTSVRIIQRLMDGSVPGCPNLQFGVVDVRDVADLHLRAMTNPAAAGQRFLAVAGDFLSMQEIARILKARLGAAAKRVPTRVLPNWLVRMAALADPSVKQILPELGKTKNAGSEKAKRRLAWTPRSTEEAIVATATGLIRLGLLP